MFEHRKLRVYDRALDLIVEVLLVLKRSQPGWSELQDQLKRACTSIILNIAEGAGEWRPAEKARFYRIAIRSAAEADAALEILVRVEVLRSSDIGPLQLILQEIAAMLVAMCKTVESRPTPKTKRR